MLNDLERIKVGDGLRIESRQGMKNTALMILDESNTQNPKYLEIAMMKEKIGADELRLK
jgi:hypothetical protein